MNSKQDPHEQYNIEGALNRYMTPAHIERYHEAIESRFSQQIDTSSSLWFAPVCRSKNFWRSHALCEDCGKCSSCKKYPYGRTQQIEITPTLEEIFQASLAIAEQTQQEIALEEPDFVPLVRTVPQEKILDIVPLVRTVPQEEIIDYNPPLIIRSAPSSEFWYYGDTEYRGELFVEDNVTYMNQEPRYDYLNNGIWLGSDGNYYYKELDSIDSNNPASMLFKPSDIIGSLGDHSPFNTCQRLDDGERRNGIICGYPIIPVNKDDHLLIQPITDLEISSIIATPIPSPDQWENPDPGFTVVDLGMQICTQAATEDLIEKAFKTEYLFFRGINTITPAVAIDIQKLVIDSFSKTKILPGATIKLRGLDVQFKGTRLELQNASLDFISSTTGQINIATPHPLSQQGTISLDGQCSIKSSTLNTLWLDSAVNLELYAGARLSIEPKTQLSILDFP